MQNNGKVTCGQTSPAEFNGGQSNPVAITSPTTATPITGVSLAANSSYLVTANPQIAVNAATNARGHIVVNCTPGRRREHDRDPDPERQLRRRLREQWGGTVTATLQQQATLPLEVSVALEHGRSARPGHLRQVAER